MQRTRMLGVSVAMLGAAEAVQGVHGVTPVATLYVDQRAPAGGNGKCWQEAFRDLQDALNEAARIPPHGPSWKERLIEVRIGQGIYTPAAAHGDRDASFDAAGYPLTSAPVLSLRGSFAGFGASDPDGQDFVATATVLSGDLNGDDGPDWTNREDNSRVILRVENVFSGFFEAEGITFCGASDRGIASSDGAGGLRIFVSGFGNGTLGLAHIVHCRFLQNETFTGDGAGLHATSDTIELESSEFRGNRAVNAKGGGAFAASYQSGWISVRNCVFSGNEARYGGGLFLSQTSWVEESQFDLNRAGRFGGALYAADDANLNSVLLVENSAELAGGAVFSGASSVLGVSMCTLASNSAPEGGAIDAELGPLAMFASIVWDTRVSTAGAAIDLGYGVFDSWITGAIVEGGEQAIAFEPGSLVLGQAIVDEDPRFIRAAAENDSDSSYWNYRPRFGSPATMMSHAMSGLLQDLDGVNFGCLLPFPDRFDAGCYFVDSCVCWANLNADWDGLVNDEDFELFVEAYNTMVTPAALPRADLDRNGLVDDADFSLFAVAYDALLCE